MQCDLERIEKGFTAADVRQHVMGPLIPLNQRPSKSGYGPVPFPITATKDLNDIDDDVLSQQRDSTKRSLMLRRFAEDAINDLLPTTIRESLRMNAKDTLTRLLRLVYAQGQRDAVDTMTAAVVPMHQEEGDR